jgi:hypothetical protein
MLRAAGTLRPLRAAVTCRLAPALRTYKGVAHPFNEKFGEPKVLQREEYVHADLVLEEAKTGFPPGLPYKRDSEIWANPDDPNQLVPPPRQNGPGALSARTPSPHHTSLHVTPHRRLSSVLRCGGTTARRNRSGLSIAAAPVAPTVAGPGPRATARHVRSLPVCLAFSGA